MPHSISIYTFVSAFLLAAFAQEIDTAIPSSAKRFTILDQIERPKERQAFLALYKKRNPGQRLDIARSFLSAYPDSWLLAEVYDIAAKACIDIGDFHDAVVYAQESLRLLPENPLLLERWRMFRSSRDCIAQGKGALEMHSSTWEGSRTPLRFVKLSGRRSKSNSKHRACMPWAESSCWENADWVTQ